MKQASKIEPDDEALEFHASPVLAKRAAKWLRP
jgi:hypothetical protein